MTPSGINMGGGAPKHTPGPWEARRDRINVVGKGVVATANNPWNDEREREANARLIAAAPELYALVEESLFHLRLDARAKAYHDKALSALAKARGEQVQS